MADYLWKAICKNLWITCSFCALISPEYYNACAGFMGLSQYIKAKQAENMIPYEYKVGLSSLFAKQWREARWQHKRRRLILAQASVFVCVWWAESPDNHRVWFHKPPSGGRTSPHSCHPPSPTPVLQNNPMQPPAHMGAHVGEAGVQWHRRGGFKSHQTHANV